MRFEDLELAPEIQLGLEEAGFVDCTPIQELSLPPALDGEDIAGQAQTGTGKTACFLLATFTRLLESDHKPRPGRPRALMVAPTRELAIQIADEGVRLGKHTGLALMTVYGGVGYDQQLRQLRAGVDIVVGTPGRLIDYVKRGELRLTDIEVCVIDEADRLFDMGFYPDLRYLVHRLPTSDKRQMMVYSATLNMRVMELAYRYMHDPVELSVAPQQVEVEQIEQVLFHVGMREKMQLLLGLLAAEKSQRVLVFVNTKSGAEMVTRRLAANGHSAAYLSGDLNQVKRLKVLDQYKAGEITILVATDVASRGLHIDDVTHIVNYDVPQDPEDYVHRIGRTARMGNTGKAFTLACENHVMNLSAVESFIGHKIPVVRPAAELFAVDKYVPEPRAYGSRSGRGGDRGGNRGGPRRGGRRPR